jgi:hypothetical protein
MSPQAAQNYYNANSNRILVSKMKNTITNNTHRRYQLACLAFSLLVTFCTAEALVPHRNAFFQVRGGESRAFARTSLNVLEETLGDDQAAEPSASKPIKQIRVSTRGGLGGTRMPPKENVNGKNGLPKRFASDNIAAHAIDSFCEVEDLPVPAEFIAETALPTDVGQFRLRAYRTSANANEYTGREPSVIYAADKSPFGVEGKLNKGVHVRIHDQCLTSEVFGSRR